MNSHREGDHSREEPRARPASRNGTHRKGGNRVGQSSAAQPTRVVRTRAIKQTSIPQLMLDCDAALRAGARLAALFARSAGGERIVVTAVLQTKDGILSVQRGTGRRGEHYPSLTAEHPAAHAFERDLWEQAGILPAGHPWLKPKRFESSGAIPHGEWRFVCLGDLAHHLEVQLGNAHCESEKLLRSPESGKLTPLGEAFVGDSSIAHAWAYCAGLEALAGTELDLPTEAVRGVALELERMAMHLRGLQGLLTSLGFVKEAATYGRLRSVLLDTSMRICGSRLGRGWLRPGGVVAGISGEHGAWLKAALPTFLSDFELLNEVVLGMRSFRERLQGVGTVNRLAAEELGLLGPAARACGLTRDARKSLPGRLWSAIPVEEKLEDTGDCWARARLRMAEIRESVRWVKDVLDRDWDLDVGRASACPSLRPSSLSVSLREGFHGEVLHVLETGGDARVRHHKVQDPSVQNWFGLALAVRRADVSDHAICSESFDLSYGNHAQLCEGWR